MVPPAFSLFPHCPSGFYVPLARLDERSAAAATVGMGGGHGGLQFTQMICEIRLFVWFWIRRR
jgi:hypothetical protein